MAERPLADRDVPAAQRDVIVVGSGKRVRETALPAFQRAAQRFTVRHVVARTRKELVVEGARYEVGALAALSRDDVGREPLFYVAVGKDAVPAVLGELERFDLTRADILIDTPVVRFKHFRHARRLEAFRSAWVAEDCTRLPWFDVVRDAARALGPLRAVTFDRAAYAYHGVASAKALLGAPSVARARRVRLGGKAARRELDLAGGGRAVVIEPRDYTAGHVALEFERGRAEERSGQDGNTSALRLEVVVAGPELRGFRLGDARTELDAREVDLARGDDPSAGLTARMDALKRVGFLRLLGDIAAGRGAYPVASALEDTVVDYWLERLGRYRATPLSDPNRALGRALLRALSRAGG